MNKKLVKEAQKQTMATAKKKLRPLQNRLTVIKEQSEEKTSGGILLPDTAKEKPQIGIVQEVGPGKRDEKGEIVPVELKPGDKVVYAKYSGTEIKIDGEEILVLKEDDIIAILED